MKWRMSNSHDEKADTEREYVHLLSTVSVSLLLVETLASESLDSFIVKVVIVVGDYGVIDFRCFVTSCSDVVRQ